MKELRNGLEKHSRLIMKVYFVISILLTLFVVSGRVFAESENTDPGVYSTALINVTARDAIDLSGSWNYIVDPQKIGILRGDRRRTGPNIPTGNTTTSSLSKNRTVPSLTACCSSMAGKTLLLQKRKGSCSTRNEDETDAPKVHHEHPPRFCSWTEKRARKEWKQ